MMNRRRQGFSLTELVVATAIAAFSLMSLAVIHSTAHGYLLQNYRQNVIKMNSTVAMKEITSMLRMANRVDAPAAGSDGNILAFAINVDQVSGCYPVNPASGTPTWHYYCYSSGVTSECTSGRCLFAHTGRIQGGAGCPGDAASPTYPVFSCGVRSGAGESVTLLGQFIEPPSGGRMFSRPASPAGPGNLVNIGLRVLWDPGSAAGTAFKSAGRLESVRKIDSTLKTTIMPNYGARGL